MVESFLKIKKHNPFYIEKQEVELNILRNTSRLDLYATFLNAVFLNTDLK